MEEGGGRGRSAILRKKGEKEEIGRLVNKRAVLSIKL